jgi:hypothetical protein
LHGISSRKTINAWEEAKNARSLAPVISAVIEHTKPSHHLNGVARHQRLTWQRRNESRGI